MDPASLLVLMISFAGAKVSQKLVNVAVDAFWTKASVTFDGMFKNGLDPLVLTPGKADAISKADPSLLDDAKSLLGNSPALRRAQRSADRLNGTVVLWVDDHPENNAWERRVLGSLGVRFLTVERTESAEASLAQESSAGRSFDLIISDIARDNADEDGILGLSRLRAAAPRTPIVFYVGALKGMGTPPGAFGITNDPEELLHLVLDVVDRTR
jgi:CheY-like chemotaxis protein